VRCEEPTGGRAQACIGGELAILGQPAGDRAWMESMAEAGAEVGSRAINGVARIEIAESLQDHFEREHFAVASRLRREGGMTQVWQYQRCTTACMLARFPALVMRVPSQTMQRSMSAPMSGRSWGRW
jgi:hypothetical protein